jgi:hypothetical protein
LLDGGFASGLGGGHSVWTVLDRHQSMYSAQVPETFVHQVGFTRFARKFWGSRPSYVVVPCVKELIFRQYAKKVFLHTACALQFHDQDPPAFAVQTT